MYMVCDSNEKKQVVSFEEFRDMAPELSTLTLKRYFEDIPPFSKKSVYSEAILHAKRSEHYRLKLKKN